MYNHIPYFNSSKLGKHLLQNRNLSKSAASENETFKIINKPQFFLFKEINSMLQD